MSLNAMFYSCSVSFQTRQQIRPFSLIHLFFFHSDIFKQTWSTNNATEFMEAWNVEIYYNNIKTSNWKSHVLIVKGSLVSHITGDFSTAASYGALASQVPTAPLLPSHLIPSHLNVSFPPLSDYSKRNPLQPLPPTSATGLLLHSSNSVTLKWLPITIVC